MIRSICLAATIQCCVAFSTPQLAPPSCRSVIHRADAITKGADDIMLNNNVDVVGSSSVLSRMHLRKKITLNASPDCRSHDSSDEPFAEHVDNSDELEMYSAGDDGGIGEYNPEEKLGLQREKANVGDPQTAQLEPVNITKVLTELQAIQSQGPKKYCILGTRHCSFLHQQIVEML
jgi:hypothetical protein